MKYPVQIDFQQNGIRDVMNAFDSIEKRVQKLGAAVEKSSERSGTARVQSETRAANQVARIAEREAKDKIRVWQKLDREVEHIRTKATRDFERDEKKKTRTLESEAKKRSDAETKALKETQRQRDQFGRAVGRGVAGTMGRVTSAVGRAGATVIGLGGGFAIGDSLSRDIRARGSAADIANSGYMPGQAGPNGKMRSVDEITGAAKAGGARFGIDQEHALTGLQAFVSKTGDLDTGLRTMQSFMELSRATGSNFEDIAAAAGDLASANKDLSAGEVEQMMRVIAGQGKLGAVELRDLATQMAKVSSSAGLFSGDKMKNLTTLGAMAQAAKGSGGAVSAEEAATSVARFGSDVSGHVGKFAAAGINVKDGKVLRGPEAIIRDSLKATGGDVSKLNDLFGERSIKSVNGFADIYRNAEGKNKGSGDEAVANEFRRLSSATMTEVQVKETAAKRMRETDAKIEAAQARLRAVIAEQLLPQFEKLLPLFEKLIPVAGEFLATFTKMVDFFSNAPIETAIGGLGLVLGAAVTKSVLAAGLSGSFGSLTASVGALGIAVAATAAAMAYIAAKYGEKDKAMSELGMNGASATQTRVALVDKMANGTLTQDDITAAQKALTDGRASAQAEAAKAGDSPIDGVMKFGAAAFKGMSQGTMGLAGIGVTETAKAAGFRVDDLSDAVATKNKAQAEAAQRATISLNELETALKAASEAAKGMPGPVNPGAPNRNGPMGPGGSTQ